MTHPLLTAALVRRQSLLTAETNALRLLDGEGDGLPDLFLETYANHWLLATRHDHLLTPELGHALRGSRRTVYWKHLDQNQKTSPEHLSGPRLDAPFPILENGVRYRIDFSAGYSQGIFLDQRDNRARVRELVRPGQTVLNTFAYTGAFSVCAALGGATTTTLDLSQPYLDWTKENFHLNELDPGEHYFCKGDTFHWLRRFAKQGRTFDGLILDPPTFSRDKQGNVFSVEKHYGDLFALALRCLTPGGWILASTNCRKLSPGDFRRQLQPHQPPHTRLEPAPMPPDFSGEPYLKAIWLLPATRNHR
ncbi:class I SAM-dependent rRNA methyltransferase [Roseibacillus ishigakijimensis]|uniref:class I SAM-dependent rRNA methyltransferase n=1 Tax=Roseibacillus ishigakijimensis TaxID=454146 RepID=UPI001F2C1DA6|nr:class I SAM-dependent methyltransferase [Roseibacillus ishigakijimensis]